MKVKDFWIPIRFHWSFIFFPLFMVYMFGLKNGLVYFFILFISTLIHEYSHVFESKRNGLFIPYIIFHGFGAGTMVIHNLLNYKKIIKISVSGPIGSLIFGIIGYCLYLFYNNQYLLYFSVISILFCFLNLLPIFPSDGGRILYAVLGMIMGPRKALNISLYVSWIFCLIGIIVCLVFYFRWIEFIIFFLLIFSVISYIEKKNMENQLRV